MAIFLAFKLIYFWFFNRLVYSENVFLPSNQSIKKPTGIELGDFSDVSEILFLMYNNAPLSFLVPRIAQNPKNSIDVLFYGVIFPFGIK